MATKEVSSAVAGRVMACNVQVGDTVAVGDEVVVIESMKLEIPVEAEQAGVVAEVLVVAGDDVEEGQCLVVLT